MGRKFLSLVLGLIVAMIVMAVDMGRYWTPLQSHYFPAYLSSSRLAGKGRYQFLFVVYPEGWRMALNQDIVRGAMSDGPGPTSLFALSDQARRAGANAIEWRFYAGLDNATAYEWLRQGIYDDKTPWELMRAPVFVGLVLTLMPFPGRCTGIAGQSANHNAVTSSGGRA